MASSHSLVLAEVEAAKLRDVGFDFRLRELELRFDEVEFQRIAGPKHFMGSAHFAEVANEENELVPFLLTLLNLGLEGLRQILPALLPFHSSLRR